MPSYNTYSLTWVSLTLGVWYLFTAAPAKHSCSLPYMRGISPRRPSWQWPIEATLRARPGAAPEVRGGGWEDQPHARGQGQRPDGTTPHPRIGGCAGTGGLREYLLEWLKLGCNGVKLEKAMAPHSSTLAWKMTWTEGPGGLHSWGL